jgi:hypothetical protein
MVIRRAPLEKVLALGASAAMKSTPAVEVDPDRNDRY